MIGVRSSRLRETLRDSFLCYVEFFEIVNSMDSSFSTFDRQKRLVGNKKYSTLMCNMIENFTAEFIELSDQYVKRIADMQKEFIFEEDLPRFIENFEHDVNQINWSMQNMRDLTISKMNSNGDPTLINKIKELIEAFFPNKNINIQGRAYIEDNREEKSKQQNMKSEVKSNKYCSEIISSNAINQVPQPQQSKVLASNHQQIQDSHSTSKKRY